MLKILGYIWKALFIVLYPFLTFFSLLYTSLIRLFSAISRTLHRLLDKAEIREEYQPSAAPFTLTLSGDEELRFNPLKPIHFGPYLYRLSAAPETLNQYRGRAFSNWNYRTSNYLLLQHWPSILEHELEEYRLLIINLDTGTVDREHRFRDFDWQVEARPEGLQVSCPSTKEVVSGL